MKTYLKTMYIKIKDFIQKYCKIYEHFLHFKIIIRIFHIEKLNFFLVFKRMSNR